MHFSDFQRILRSTPAAETGKKNRTNKPSLFIRLTVGYLSPIETLSIPPR